MFLLHHQFAYCANKVGSTSVFHTSLILHSGIPLRKAKQRESYLHIYAWPPGLDAQQILPSRTVVSLSHLSNQVDTCTGAELADTCKLEPSVQASVRDFGFTPACVLFWAEITS